MIFQFNSSKPKKGQVLILLKMFIWQSITSTMAPGISINNKVGSLTLQRNLMELLHLVTTQQQ